MRPSEEYLKRVHPDIYEALDAEELDSMTFLMEGYRRDCEPVEERKPEYEYCGHCGSKNCRNNDTCIKCNKLKTWVT